MICFTTCAFVRRFSCSKDCLLLCGAASLMLRCTQMSGNWHPSIGSERFNPRFIRERIHTGLVVSSLLACYGSCWILLDLDLDQFRLRSQRLRSHRSDSRFGYILNSADPSATWLGNVGNVGNVGTGDEIGWKVSKERRSSMPSAPYTHVFLCFFIWRVERQRVEMCRISFGWLVTVKLCTSDEALIVGRGVHEFPSRCQCHA